MVSLKALRASVIYVNRPNYNRGVKRTEFTRARYDLAVDKFIGMFYDVLITLCRTATISWINVLVN